MEKSLSLLMHGQIQIVLHSWQSLPIGLRLYLLELLELCQGFVYDQILLDFTGYLDDTLESILLSASYI